MVARGLRGIRRDMVNEQVVRILVECILVLLVFFRNSQSWHYWHFCVTLYGDKLEIVANQMSTNSDLSRAY